MPFLLECLEVRTWKPSCGTRSKSWTLWKALRWRCLIHIHWPPEISDLKTSTMNINVYKLSHCYSHLYEIEKKVNQEFNHPSNIYKWQFNQTLVSTRCTFTLCHDCLYFDKLGVLQLRWRFGCAVPCCSPSSPDRRHKPTSRTVRTFQSWQPSVSSRLFLPILMFDNVYWNRLSISLKISNWIQSDLNC